MLLRVLRVTMHTVNTNVPSINIWVICVCVCVCRGYRFESQCHTRCLDTPGVVSVCSEDTGKTRNLDI